MNSNFLTIISTIIGGVSKPYHSALFAVSLGVLCLFGIGATIHNQLNSTYEIISLKMIQKTDLELQLLNDADEFTAKLHLRSIDILSNDIIRYSNSAQFYYSGGFIAFFCIFAIVYWGIWSVGNTFLKARIGLKREKARRSFGY